MFLTDDESPTSTDINVYNEFVQVQAAAGHADIQEHASQFRVLGSTADDDARDNTETTSSDTDAPIYWLNGAKVADNYADLYDELLGRGGKPQNRRRRPLYGLGHRLDRKRRRRHRENRVQRLRRPGRNQRQARRDEQLVLHE